MTNAQELAARINEATIALFYPTNSVRVGQLVAQADTAYEQAHELGLDARQMDRIHYAYDAFQVQVQGR